MAKKKAQFGIQFSLAIIFLLFAAVFKPDVGVAAPYYTDSFEHMDVHDDIGFDLDSEYIFPSIGPSVNPTIQPTVIPIVASTIFRREVSNPTPQIAVTENVPEDVKITIDKYASEYGVDPNKMAKIAKCESGYRSDSVSPSGAYVGMYQFQASTWISNRSAMGLDPDISLRVNAEETIKTAAFKMSRDGYGAWPICSSV